MKKLKCWKCCSEKDNNYILPIVVLSNKCIKTMIIQNQKSRTQWHQQHRWHSSHANICHGLASLIVSTDQSPAPTPGFDHIDQHHLSNRKTNKYNVPTKTILHNHFINLPAMISLLSSVVPEIYFAGYGSSPVSTSTHWDASWERISVLARGPSNTPDSR